MLTATASPIHLRAPCEFLLTFLKRKVFEGITSAGDFTSPSQLSRHQGMRATFAHSAPRFMPVLNREPYATRQNKQTKKQTRPGTASDSLPAPLQGEGSRTLYAELRSAAPRLGQKAVHGNTNCPCTASSSPTVQAVPSSSSATIGKRATVRQTRARGATATGRWREGQGRVLPSGTVRKYIKYDVGHWIVVRKVHYCTTYFSGCISFH